MMNLFRLRRPFRHGATAVEFAVVAPILFTVVFTSIELGRCLLIIHSLEEAARVGCRIAILNKKTEADVRSAVDAELANAGIGVHSPATINPNPLSNACLWEPVTVSVAISYGSVSLLPTPQFLNSIQLSGSSTLPREGNPCPS